MGTRVVVEDTHGGVPHALTPREARAVVRLAAAELGRVPGLVVHLKATLPESVGFDRPVVYSAYSRRLNVSCRGLSRERAVREILRELVVTAEGVALHHGHRLSREARERVDRRVAEILPRALEALDPGAG